MKVVLNRLDDAFHFEAKNEDGVTMHFDAGPDHGGKNQGVRPMQSLLMALGGCSAIDIILILKKQKQEITSFSMEIDGEREKGKEPALWENAHVIYRLDGKVENEKAKRAVQLSMEKYCSVSQTLEKAGAKITWEIHVNGKLIP
ncbi:MAG TPA: OsmC family protein [Bacteroidia bacterium]|nr:OsmC family protein [Bacteroidia bacterium]